MKVDAYLPLIATQQSMYMLYVPFERVTGEIIDVNEGEKEIHRILSKSFLESRVGVRVADYGVVGEVSFCSVGAHGKQIVLDEIVLVMCDIATSLQVGRTMLVENKVTLFEYVIL